MTASRHLYFSRCAKLQYQKRVLDAGLSNAYRDMYQVRRGLAQLWDGNTEFLAEQGVPFPVPSSEPSPFIQRINSTTFATLDLEWDLDAHMEKAEAYGELAEHAERNPPPESEDEDDEDEEDDGEDEGEAEDESSSCGSGVEE